MTKIADFLVANERCIIANNVNNLLCGQFALFAHEIKITVDILVDVASARFIVRD